MSVKKYQDNNYKISNISIKDKLGNAFRTGIRDQPDMGRNKARSPLSVQIISYSIIYSLIRPNGCRPYCHVDSIGFQCCSVAVLSSA